MNFVFPMLEVEVKSLTLRCAGFITSLIILNWIQQYSDNREVDLFLEPSWPLMGCNQQKTGNKNQNTNLDYLISSYFFCCVLLVIITSLGLLEWPDYIFLAHNPPDLLRNPSDLWKCRWGKQWLSSRTTIIQLLTWDNVQALTWAAYRIILFTLLQTHDVIAFNSLGQVQILQQFSSVLFVGEISFIPTRMRHRAVRLVYGWCHKMLQDLWLMCVHV